MTDRERLLHTGWDEIPLQDDGFIREAFATVAAHIREKSGGYAYRLERMNNSYLLAPNDPDGTKFKLEPKRGEYRLSAAYMAAGETPDYLGALDDVFISELENTLAAGMTTRPRVAYRNYIDGRPAGLNAELDALDRMHDGLKKAARQSLPEQAPIASPRDSSLQTLRKAKPAGGPAPAWLLDR